MEDRIQKAVELFKSGYNCSQSVVAAFADMYGFTQEQAPFSGCKCRKNNFITVMVMHEKAAQMQLLRGSSLSNVVGFHSLDDW